MLRKNREPRLSIAPERAIEHVNLTIRRAWAGRIPDFENWGGHELDPDPLIIHDLNGQVLFYEYAVMDGKEIAGTVKASASKIIGPAVPAVEFGPRGWDPGQATREAEKYVVKTYKNAKVKDTALVCYSYPSIGVRVDFDHPKQGKQSIILDAADLSPIEKYGVEGLEGKAAWSFYDEIAEPEAARREQIWDRADEELEAARGDTPQILEQGFTSRELPELQDVFIPELHYDFIPFFSSGTIKYSPRCSPHECFALYAQQTSVYCAVATGQMILDFYRYYYDQDDIAAAMGTGSGGSSNSGQVTGYESLSNKCLDATYDASANWSEAVSEINANRPLKSGIPGHARACVGWKRQNIFLIGQQPKHWLKIYDPWPWNANICAGGRIVWEDWDTVTHTNFIYIRHRSTACT